MKTPRVILNTAAGNTLGGDNTLHGREFRTLCLGSALAFALITPGAGHAGETEANSRELVPATHSLGLQLEPDLHGQYFLAQNSAVATPQTTPQATLTAPDTDTRKPDRSGEAVAAKDYLLPAEEIVGFNLLLNRFNYYFIDKQVYGSNLNTIRTNLSNKWVVDTDPFAINQFMHPYQGSMYFGMARSADLDFWESLGYSFGGSLLWEIAGETGAPSINDLVTTGFAGAFLGEPLFRMASLLLEGGGQTPGFWRELGAACQRRFKIDTVLQRAPI